MYKAVLSLILLFQLCISIQAQVTIGSNIPPRSGALLDLKEHNSSEGTLVTSSKGLLMPRVFLQNVNELEPLIASATSADKSETTGMIVYNMNNKPEEDLAEGVVVWDGEKWQSLQECEGVVPAAFNVESVSLRGVYTRNVELTPLNYLSVVIDVVVLGKYVITGTTTNGYSFVVSGEFTTPGVQTINVPGTGTPVQSTNDKGGVKDDVAVKINDYTTTIPNTVLDKPLDYLIDCSTLTINGTYIKGQALSSSTHYLSLGAIATAPSADGLFQLGTETVNGYSYTASGLLTAGSQTFTVPVTTGQIPLEQGLNQFTLTTNSTLATTTCPFNILVVNPGLSVSINYYSYGGYPSSMMTILNSADNYGPTGAYNKIEKYTAAYSGKTISVIRTELNSATPPDVAIVNYAETFTASDTTAILRQVRNGRYVIYSVDGTSTAQTNLVRGVISGLINVAQSQILVTTTGTGNDATLVSADALDAKYRGIIRSDVFGDVSGGTFVNDGGSNWGVAIDTSVDPSISSKFVALSNIIGAPTYARIFVVEDPVSRGAFIMLCDGGSWSNLVNSGYETKNILFKNIMGWIADRRYAE